MELVKEVKSIKRMNNFGIYKLSNDELKILKRSQSKPYYVSNGIFADYVFNYFSLKNLISCKPYYYEGFYENLETALLSLEKVAII